MLETHLPAFLAVLTASILGSPHCAAMCGGFTTLAAGTSSGSSIGRVGAYHVGRLVTYQLSALGAAAFAVSLSSRVAGVLLIVVGVLLLFRVRIVPASIHRAMTKGYRQIISRVKPRSVFFPFVVGFASTFLPCGWLYVYVGIAASSSYPMLTMFAFWLGTLPVLTVWSTASSRILSATGRLLPALQALLLVLAGVYSIVQHAPMQDEPTACHEHAH